MTELLEAPAQPAGARVSSSGLDSFDLAHRLISSERLRARRYEMIPLRGPGAAHTEAQGRGPSEGTSAAGLADLISSISLIGVLQPVLLEETTDPAGGLPRRSVVAGERRLRACRYGATAMPDNPHFASLPAVICPGPLSAEERYIWQLAENLAREGLRPGELGAALMFARCALLTSKLLAAGTPVPVAVATIPDPCDRFAALEKLRTAMGEPAAGASGASWAEVLRRIGIQMSARQARAVAAAFRDLPREISAEMDEHHVRLATRQGFLKLHGGRADAAAALWAAVKERGRLDLLPAAIRTLLAGEHGETGAAPDDLVDVVDATLAAAAAGAEHANTARALALSAPPGGRSPVPEPREDTPVDDAEAADPGIVEAVLSSLRTLRRHLAEPRSLPVFAAGSIRLLVDEVLEIG